MRAAALVNGGRTGVFNKRQIRTQVGNILFPLKRQVRKWKQRQIREELTAAAVQRVQDSAAAARRIFFCGVPIHSNMGDQAQRYCIWQWCKENYPDYTIVELPTWPFYDKKFRAMLKRSVRKGDRFVIQSGYCTTSRHYDHEMHRFLVKNFLDYPILIMPQTVNFRQKKDGRKTGRIYDRHPSLLFLARDQRSCQFAQEYFPKTDVRLFPDIVTTLIGTGPKTAARKGVLLCVRNDGEKLYSDGEIQTLQQRFREQNILCEITDTTLSQTAEQIRDHFPQALEKLVGRFSSYQVVITDRYHGTIFSMISNTPVIVLATRDHKVKTGTEWFRGVYDRSFCNAASLEEAHTLAVQLLASNENIENGPYFQAEYYDHLREIWEGKE